MTTQYKFFTVQRRLDQIAHIATRARRSAELAQIVQLMTDNKMNRIVIKYDPNYGGSPFPEQVECSSDTGEMIALDSTTELAITDAAASADLARRFFLFGDESLPVDMESHDDSVVLKLRNDEDVLTAEDMLGHCMDVTLFSHTLNDLAAGV